MIGETVWTVIKWYGHVSDGEGTCLKVFSTYEKARAFCEGYTNWYPDYCDPGNDSWGDEYFTIEIEERTVE
jgi:hypothetical protein